MTEISLIDAKSSIKIVSEEKIDKVMKAFFEILVNTRTAEEEDEKEEEDLEIKSITG